MTKQPANGGAATAAQKEGRGGACDHPQIQEKNREGKYDRKGETGQNKRFIFVIVVSKSKKKKETEMTLRKTVTLCIVDR